MPRSPVADPELERLIDVFDGMLDAVETLRGLHRRLTFRSLDAAERDRDVLARRLYAGPANDSDRAAGERHRTQETRMTEER